jgi:hypothetical protein
VCETSWAYQGVFCEKCHDIDKYDNWTQAKKGGLVFIGVSLLCAVIFLLFFLPLFPGVEAAIASATAPTMERMERALGNVAAAVRPRSSSSRPGSARQLPAAIAGLAALTRQLRRIDTVALRRADSMAPSSMGGGGDGGSGFGGRRSNMSFGLTRRSGGTSFRRSSVRMGVAPAADAGQGRTSSVHVRLERPSRVRLFVDMASEPLRVRCLQCALCVPLHVMRSSRVADMRPPFLLVRLSSPSGSALRALRLRLLHRISCNQHQTEQCSKHTLI